MRTLRAVFQRRRQFGIEQVSGFMLIGGGVILWMAPNTPSVAWISRLWGASYLAGGMVALFMICGWLLCLSEKSRWQVYAALTAPILVYGALLFSYYLVYDIPVFTAGVFCAFWVFMQYAHSQIQEVRAWIKP